MKKKPLKTLKKKRKQEFKKFEENMEKVLTVNKQDIPLKKKKQ